MSATTYNPTTTTMDWDSRADVIYHFYAYHFFDNKPRHTRSIDMINLTDADIQHYQRIADLARGLNEHYKLAEYLKTQGPYTLPTSFANGSPIPATIHGGVKLSFRQRLVHHVHVYNLTQEPRRRFFLLGLANEDVDFPKSLIESYDASALDDSGYRVIGPGDKIELAMATDMCEALPRDSVFSDYEVEFAVEKYLADRRGAKTTASGEDSKTET